MSKKKNLLSGFLSDIVDQQVSISKEQEITIIPELKELIPPLTPDEYKQLTENIIAEGCRDPLVVWKNGNEIVLIDGHNRYSICREYNITYRTVEKEFKDLEEVKDWMINNQLGKRNLTEEQKSYLRGLQYIREKKKVGGSGENQFTKKTTKSNVDKLSTKRTADKLAEQHQVSSKTIQRDEKYAIGLNKLTKDNDELKQDILNKKIKVPSSLIQDLATEEDSKKIKKVKEALSKGDTEKAKSVLLGNEKTLENKVNPKVGEIRTKIQTLINKIEDLKVLKKIEQNIKEELEVN